MRCFSCHCLFFFSQETLKLHLLLLALIDGGAVGHQSLVRFFTGGAALVLTVKRSAENTGKLFNNQKLFCFVLARIPVSSLRLCSVFRVQFRYKLALLSVSLSGRFLRWLSYSYL